jgi:hypothetical protein
VSSEQTASTPPQEELAQTKARANLLVALYAHATHDLERVTRERDDVRGELAHARTEIQRLKDELAHSAVRAKQQQQRYAALLESTSWRMTAPLRALVRLFKRES